MRGAILSCVALLLACGGVDEFEEGDDMNRRIRGISVGDIQPEQWGQQRVFPVGSLPLLRNGGGTSILKVNPLPEWRIPRVQSLIASVQNDDADVQQLYFLRWLLTSGIGGARTSVVFDAVGFTRLNLPAEQLELSIGYEPYAGGSDSPTGIVTAHGYVGDGSTDGIEPGPTYTAYFNAAGFGGTAQIRIPVGAARFRVTGDIGSALNPFLATTEVLAMQGGTTVSRWRGLGAAPADPSLWSLYNSGQFIPLQGGTSLLQVTNGAGAAIEGFIQFGLDL